MHPTTALKELQRETRSAWTYEYGLLIDDFHSKRHFLYSPIPPVENGPFRLDFFSTKIFWSFLEAVGVREYCCTAVEIGWQLCASRFHREQRLDEPSSQRVGGFGLSRKPSMLRSWSCTQPRAAKATAAQPLLATWDRYPALLPSCDTRCRRAELGMRHADLLREATAVIATPASAPCIILQCGTWYRCVAVWPCGCVFGGGMGDAIGSINTCKTFSTDFFDWRIQSKKLCKKARFGLQSKKAVFD